MLGLPTCSEIGKSKTCRIHNGLNPKMNINYIFETLSSNNSRNFKLEFLSDHKDTPLLKEVINLALNPFILFYIKKIPKYTKNQYHITLGAAISMLELLSNRQITGNSAIEHLANILSSVEPEDAKVIERIINKDLKCGVSVATVNSIWKNLIPEYPIMLASKFDQKLIDRLTFPVICQEKADGARFNAIIQNHNVTFYTRSGNVLYIPNEGLKFAFQVLGNCFDFPVVIDGEFVVAENNWNLMDRQKGNGILTKCIRNTITETEAKGLRAIVWDVIPVENYRQGFWKETALTRYEVLKEKVDIFNHDYIRMIPMHMVNSFEEAEVIFNDYLNQGKEGIIIKDSNGVWESKRSSSWIKMKAEKDVDCEVIGWIEGTGKYVGKLGALSCRAGSVEFNVGSGFTDIQREEITPENIIGKIISVKYNGIIADKRTGKKSLFLPIFLMIRDDKTEADIL